jgi:hypothetical protein
MKKHAVLLWTALLLACLLAAAGAEAPQKNTVDPFLGGWINDDYRMYIRLEGDEIYCRLTETKGDYVWEYDRCWFDAETAQLNGLNCVRYREYIDWDTMELVQEDWALGDLGLTCFEFGEDEDTLIAVDIPELAESLTFHRGSDEECFGS